MRKVLVVIRSGRAKTSKVKIIPFGALVEYKGPDTRKQEQPGKFGGRGTPGIFAGYELGELGRWSKLYLVWNQSDFTGVNIASDVMLDLSRFRGQTGSGQWIVSRKSMNFI